MFYNQVYGRYTERGHIRRGHKALRSEPKIIATPVPCIFLIDLLQKLCIAHSQRKSDYIIVRINVLSATREPANDFHEMIYWEILLSLCPVPIFIKYDNDKEHITSNEMCSIHASNWTVARTEHNALHEDTCTGTLTVASSYKLQHTTFSMRN